MSDTIYVEASCIICKNSYDPAVNRPRVLPCSHSFCQDCLLKLEAAGDKLCPVCRKSFKNVRISDLPSCYQLIPAEGQAVRNKIHDGQNDCQEHGENYIFWCSTCVIPACKKCWQSKHVGCDVVLIEEKSEALAKEYLKSFSFFKDVKCPELSMHILANKTHIKFVKDLIDKFQILEIELMQYQKTLDAREKRAVGILSDGVPKVPSPLSLLEMSLKTSEVKTMAHEIQARPNSLLLQIACSYNGTAEDADAFATNLKKYGNQQTSGKFDLKLIGNKALQEKAAPELKDGEVWTISDLVSAVAVDKKILTSSARPSRLRVTWTNKPEHVFGSFLDVGRPSESSSLCPADFDLDCFLSFETQSRQTLAQTSALVDKAARRFHITRFCGHLDAAAVQQLPSTIKCVGLVLRDQQDMAAFNALCKVAFTTSYKTWIKDRLLWRNWTELNLSIANTFQPNFWNVTWQLVPTYRGKLISIKMVDTLRNFGVRLRLHLPQLLPGDLPWLKELLSAMNLNASLTAAMFLHSTSVDPDPLLGVLRDCGQRWEVHLPASQPQLVPREQVTARYKKRGHSVTWDLE